MGFMSGLITGIAVAAAAAAWYSSRAGQQFRDQYQVDQRLGELGEQFEARSRDIQEQVNAQIADIRSKAESITGNENGHDAAAPLDDAAASAAEAAAETAAKEANS